MSLVGSLAPASGAAVQRRWPHSVISPSDAYFAVPAFANTTSSLPFSCLICENRRSRSPSFETSPWTPVTFFPISFTAAASSPSRRPVMKTCAPSLANRFAVASPMPLLPPVTSAIFPSSLPICSPYQVRLSGPDAGIQRLPHRRVPVDYRPRQPKRPPTLPNHSCCDTAGLGRHRTRCQLGVTGCPAELQTAAAASAPISSARVIITVGSGSTLKL